MQEDNQCAWCVKPLTKNQLYRHVRYCSVKCWYDAGRPKTHPPIRNCECCESEFQPMKVGQSLCSNGCKHNHCAHLGYAKKLSAQMLRAVKSRFVCAVCGNLCFKSGKYQKICGKDSCSEQRKALYRDSSKVKSKNAYVSVATHLDCECRYCGQSFVSANAKGSKFCSEACRAKCHKKNRKKTTKDRDLVLQFLYQRNRNCGVCNEHVDLTLQGLPHLKAPSIDHIKPISKGGVHSIDNVQLTHFQCNSRKGAS